MGRSNEELGESFMQIVSKSVELLPITCVILTKNEEPAIRDCLESVNFCQQIVVFDSNSTDKTSDIVFENGSQLINFTWNGSYPKKKQWALQHPSILNDWVLMLDADERVSNKLRDSITEFFASGKSSHAAFDVEISYTFANKLLKHGHRVSKRILLDKRKCAFPILNDLNVKNMWEVEGHYQPIVNGSLGQLTGKLIHADPDSMFDYFSRHNRYSDWEAHIRVNNDDRVIVRRAKSFHGRIFDRMPGKPLVFFIYSFFIRLGFLDGKAGFNYALALAFYYWQISLKVDEGKYVSQIR